MGKINNSIVTSDEKILRQKGYALNRILGEGSFSKVKSAIWQKPGSSECLPVAIKIINKATAPKNFIEKFWPREADVMNIVSHENIIQMYDVFMEGNKIYMSLEQASHGDLLEYVQLKGPLGEYETHKYFTEMCSGIKYLHGKQIVHRDLKCENILLTDKNTVKIADFGFARRMNESDLSKTFCGSAAYAAPEVLQGIPYGPSTPDIWSLGVILFIMACGVMPFRDSSIGRLLKDQKSSCLQFPNKKDLNRYYCNLVKGILRYDLQTRFGLHDICKHRWMQTSKLSKIPSFTDSGIGSDRSSSTLSSAD